MQPGGPGRVPPGAHGRGGAPSSAFSGSTPSPARSKAVAPVSGLPGAAAPGKGRAQVDRPKMVSPSTMVWAGLSPGPARCAHTGQLAALRLGERQSAATTPIVVLNEVTVAPCQAATSSSRGSRRWSTRRAARTGCRTAARPPGRARSDGVDHGHRSHGDTRGQDDAGRTDAAGQPARHGAVARPDRPTRPRIRAVRTAHPHGRTVRPTRPHRSGRPTCSPAGPNRPTRSPRRSGPCDRTAASYASAPSEPSRDRAERAATPRS